MAEKHLSIALLCIKDYKAAFEGLQKIYEKEMESRCNKLEKSTEQVDFVSDVELFESKPGFTYDNHNAHIASCGHLDGTSTKLLEDELSKLRSDYEILTKQMFSNRAKSSTEITNLKHSLDIANFEKARLQAIVEYSEAKRRSRPPTPQPHMDELSNMRSQLELSVQKIKDLESTITSLQSSRDMYREKYQRLKSKYSMMTEKIKSSLLEQFAQPSPSPLSRTMSLLQLYPLLSSW